MVLCKDVIEAKDGNSADINNINYGRRPAEGVSESDVSKSSNVRSNNQRPSRQELIKALNYWQSRNLLKEKERYPERKIRADRKCYTEYFVAKNLDRETGEQRTVAELVAENVSNKIVLLAFIATKPEARCSGIGSQLMNYFRQTVEEENPEATIFFEVDDPDVPDISDAERHIRKRRINWYLRQGAVMWNGYYEYPNFLDRRRHGTKAIFMALPRAGEKISFTQLQEAALEILKTASGLSTNHWLYKKVQSQRPALNLTGMSEVSTVESDTKASDAGGMIREALSQTLSFLKAQLRDSTKYGALSPEEAIKRYLELERSRKLERFEESKNTWNVSELASFGAERVLA
ncbi:MAG: hypothetical protein C5B53_01860 [Candidatus Melainabacteria bacterium]|nr:MAG: hypothetical protein C5B53_01860 [Candidatus Melainabacteria bacterium]